MQTIFVGNDVWSIFFQGDLCGISIFQNTSPSEQQTQASLPFLRFTHYSSWPRVLPSTLHSLSHLVSQSLYLLVFISLPVQNLTVPYFDLQYFSLVFSPASTCSRRLVVSPLLACSLPSVAQLLDLFYPCPSFPVHFSIPSSTNYHPHTGTRNALLNYSGALKSWLDTVFLMTAMWPRWSVPKSACKLGFSISDPVKPGLRNLSLDKCLFQRLLWKLKTFREVTLNEKWVCLAHHLPRNEDPKKKRKHMEIRKPPPSAKSPKFPSSGGAYRQVAAMVGPFLFFRKRLTRQVIWKYLYVSIYVYVSGDVRKRTSYRV